MTSAHVDAVLFDLGNTLVSYYRKTDFYPILARSISAVVHVLESHGRSSLTAESAFERAKAFNRERPDFCVWPLEQRLNEIFATGEENLPGEILAEMSQQFLEPILATGRVYPDAIPVLGELRSVGLKCAIVSNTPWGSPAAPWREELRRWGLLDLVDEAVFCVDVGWRKPAPQIFRHTLARLGVTANRALFVGDDVTWDIEGARGAGIAPVLMSEGPAAGSDYPTIQRLTDLVPMLRR